jgi:hypothetical protein
MSARTTTSVQYHDGTVLQGIAVKKHVGAAPAKTRQVIVAPTLSSRVDYGAHNNDLPNLLRALNERVFNVEACVDGIKGLVPTPQPHQGVWRSLSYVAKRLATKVINVGWFDPLTCDEFVNQCPANKKALYTRAAKLYVERGWSARDAKIKCFVKFEKINFTKKADPAPRIIQPRTPVYNIALGRFTRCVEEKLYHALAEEWGVMEGEKVVMKGLTVEEVAHQLRLKWNRVRDPVALGLDASRFDQHVSRDALIWEHSIYKKLFGYNPELAALLKMQLNNRGYAFVDGHKIEYKVDGTRASGDMNTSLGNCLIMCELVLEYVRSVGINAQFANNGDDCVLIIERADLAKVANLDTWFLTYGFEMKLESTATTFEHIEFCQMQPVMTCASTDSWVMVRQPVSAFGKDAMSLAVNTELGFRQWSYQVGVGGHALYGDMPIYCELYEAYRRNGIPSNVSSSYVVSDSGFIRLTKVPRIRGNTPVPVTDDVRLSFYSAFGYPPSVQIAMERELRAMDYAGLVRLGNNISVGWGLSTL